MTPKDVLDHLLGSEPRALSDLPTGPGIYALYDHEGRPRYIGSTEMGILKRVHRYHAAGDGNSHKFSTVYNAGLMWHQRKDPRTVEADGKVAKELRRLFTRATCKAVGVEISGMTNAEIVSLENRVIAIAPEETVTWNRARVLPTIYPEAEVRVFLDRLGWGPAKIDALERQAARWRN